MKISWIKRLPQKQNLRNKKYPKYFNKALWCMMKNDRAPARKLKWQVFGRKKHIQLLQTNDPICHIQSLQHQNVITNGQNLTTESKTLNERNYCGLGSRWFSIRCIFCYWELWIAMTRTQWGEKGVINPILGDNESMISVWWVSESYIVHSTWHCFFVINGVMGSRWDCRKLV